MIFSNPVRNTIHPIGWQRPTGNLDFRVTQSFGCTGVVNEPAFGNCAHYHRGIDLGNGHCGADVLAPGPGIVHFAGTLTDGAKTVVIDHGGGWFSDSGHLSRVMAVTGHHVAKGAKIGEIGQTGNATACHDHFAIKSGMDGSRSFFADGNGTWQDPWKRLEQNVTVKPNRVGVNIRTDAQMGPVYAQAKPDGRLHRASDDADLGPTASWRKWGGEVPGASYSVDGTSGHTWDRIYLGGAYRFVASLLSERSAS